MEENKRKNRQVERKKEIIKSAKMSILKNGYKKTTIEGIMKNINSSKGSFYNSFENKEELLNGILDEILEGIEERSKLFFNTMREIETEKKLGRMVMEGIKLSFYLDKIRIFNSLFLINLTNNIEILEERIRNKLIRIKKKQNDFWENILLEGVEEDMVTLDGKMSTEYGRLLSNIVFDSFRRHILYSNDSNFYITSLIIAEEKINSIETKKEIEFLYEIIMKILQGEKRR